MDGKTGCRRPRLSCRTKDSASYTFLGGSLLSLEGEGLARHQDADYVVLWKTVSASDNPSLVRLAYTEPGAEDGTRDMERGWIGAKGARSEGGV